MADLADPAPPPAQAPTTAQQVAAAWLRRAIASGRLSPGDRVVQEAVAEQVGVSLIPVREALRMLESEGLVTYRPRRGYVVTELSLGDLEEVYRLRRLLEDDAVRRGLPQATDADLAAMAVADADCKRAAAAADIAAELAANRRFHFALFGTAHSEPELRLIRALWDQTEAYRALYYDLPGGQAAAEAAHAAILTAAAARDVESLIGELDEHRERALTALRAVLAG